MSAYLRYSPRVADMRYCVRISQEGVTLETTVVNCELSRLILPEIRGVVCRAVCSTSRAAARTLTLWRPETLSSPTATKKH